MPKTQCTYNQDNINLSGSLVVHKNDNTPSLEKERFRERYQIFFGNCSASFIIAAFENNSNHEVTVGFIQKVVTDRVILKNQSSGYIYTWPKNLLDSDSDSRPWYDTDSRKKNPSVNTRIPFDDFPPIQLDSFNEDMETQERCKITRNSTFELWLAAKYNNAYHWIKGIRWILDGEAFVKKKLNLDYSETFTQLQGGSSTITFSKWINGNAGMTNKPPIKLNTILANSSTVSKKSQSQCCTIM